MCGPNRLSVIRVGGASGGIIETEEIYTEKVAVALKVFFCGSIIATHY